MKQNSTEKTLYRYIDLFEKRLQHNKSKYTVVNYISDLNQFVTYLQDNNISYNLDKFDKDQFLDYIDYLKSKYAPATVNRKSISLNEFLTFLNRTGRLKKAPFIDGKELREYLPSVPKKRVKSLNKSQLKAMVSSCDSPFEECMIRVFYDTACRVSEIVAMEWNRISIFEDGTGSIVVFGKGKGGMTKERVVFLTKETVQCLQELRKEQGGQFEFVFTSERTKKPISTRRASQIVEKIAGKCGIENVSSHVFRKSKATSLLDKGMDITKVSKYLGHSSLQTTMNSYIDIDGKMKSEYEKYSEGI